MVLWISACLYMEVLDDYEFVTNTELTSFKLLLLFTKILLAYIYLSHKTFVCYLKFNTIFSMAHDRIIYQERY